MSQNTPPEALPRAGVLRQFAAMLYDGLLLAAVLLIAAALGTAFTGGEAVRAGNPLFSTYLLLVTFFFFGWFWVHGGQTLGMRAWRLRLQRAHGHGLTWWHALVRFMTGLPAWIVLFLAVGSMAPRQGDEAGLLALLYGLPTPLLFGIGIGWLILDHLPRSWRDRFSETEVVALPKER